MFRVGWLSLSALLCFSSRVDSLDLPSMRLRRSSDLTDDASWKRRNTSKDDVESVENLYPLLMVFVALICIFQIMHPGAY